MKIEVNITKKYFFSIIGLILILGGFIFVYAAYPYTSTSQPNPGHGADRVWININGSEMTLQDAITQGKFNNTVVIENTITQVQNLSGTIAGGCYTRYITHGSTYETWGNANAGASGCLCPSNYTAQIILTEGARDTYLCIRN